MQVDLLPTQLTQYNLELHVDVVDIGESLAALPLIGEAVRSEVVLASPVVNFGHCFLGETRTATVTLINRTERATKFEVNPPSTTSVEFSAELSAGVGVSGFWAFYFVFPATRSRG